MRPPLRGSGCACRRGSPGRPRRTSTGSAPRARIATPLRCCCPLPERAVAGVASAARGKVVVGASSVSCRQTTSGCGFGEPLEQRAAGGALMPLTLKVAIFIGAGAPVVLRWPLARRGASGARALSGIDSVAAPASRAGCQRRSNSALLTTLTLLKRHRRAGEHRARAARTPPAECRRRCRRRPRTGSAGSWRRCGARYRARRPPARGSPRISVMPAACIATSVPVAIAMPTSAAASAGASLMPSPTIATRVRRPLELCDTRPCRPAAPRRARRRCPAPRHRAPAAARCRPLSSTVRTPARAAARRPRRRLA